jgi:hypothetical protein
MMHVQFPYLGQWRVVGIATDDVELALRTVRGRYRLGPYVTLTALPGCPPGVDMVKPRDLRRGLKVAAVVGLCLTILSGILMASCAAALTPPPPHPAHSTR